MNWTSYLEAIRRNSAALANAAALGLDPAVPSCPGWMVRDVVGHTAAVQRQKERIVRERRMDGGPDLEEPPEEGLIEWFRAGSELLLDTLANTDPALPVFSWHAADQTVGFWYRRMAHETAIHRADAEIGHGIINPVEAGLAADGVDEVLTVMMEGYPGWASATESKDTMTIECTDQPGRWSMRFITWSGKGPESGTEYRDEPGIVFEEAAKPSAVLRGTASDLDLFLWGRGPSDKLTAEGNQTLVDRLRALAALSTG